MGVALVFSESKRRISFESQAICTMRSTMRLTHHCTCGAGRRAVCWTQTGSVYCTRVDSSAEYGTVFLSQREVGGKIDAHILKEHLLQAPLVLKLIGAVVRAFSIRHTHALRRFCT